MIGQIAPLVQREPRAQRLLVLHTAGGLFGGLTVGSLIGLGSEMLQPWRSSTPGSGAIVAGVLAITAGLVAVHDLGLRWAPALTSRRQTPKSWSCALGREPACFTWGLDLGTGLTTRIFPQMFWLLPVYLLFLGSLTQSLIAFSVFGTARAAIVSGICWSSRSLAEVPLGFINHWSGRWLRTSGFASSLVSIIFVSSALRG